MSVLTDHFVLSNGASIPQLGLGTWQTPDEVAPSAVEAALNIGYRHIDTARVYRNERGVGLGLRDSGISREQVFITTKVPADHKSYEQAKADIETSLSELGVDYVDLWLIHAPRPWPEMFGDTGQRYFAENLQVWRALEEAYQRGQAKSIGVSNFDVADLTNLTDHCTIAPVANQIRFHIGHTQDEVTTYCRAHRILIEAYSPIGTGRLLDNADIVAMAEQYNV
jgi:diketogulonate reductase-like aldo/keto reductase